MELTAGGDEPTFELVSGNGIRCRACGLTSYSPIDVVEVYCGNCHRYHDEPIGKPATPPALTTEPATTTMTGDEALQILQDASEALSHASYCAIVGMAPNVTAIHPPWDRLREVIDFLAPEPRLCEDGEERQPEPTLWIVDVEP